MTRTTPYRALSHNSNIPLIHQTHAAVLLQSGQYLMTVQDTSPSKGTLNEESREMLLLKVPISQLAKRSRSSGLAASWPIFHDYTRHELSRHGAPGL